MKRYWIHPFEALKRHARKRGPQTAFSFYKLGDRHFEKPQNLSWSEVFERVLRYRSYLVSLGLKRGYRIAIKGRNGPEWVMLDWAALLMGLVSVPIYGASTNEEVAFILKETEAKFLFVDELDEGYPISQIDFGTLEKESSRFEAATDFEIYEDPDAVATLIYTSGTSGTPKGVIHTYRNLSEALLRANDVVHISANDRLVSYLPLSHVAERMLIEFGALYTGAHITFLDRVERLAHALPSVRPTMFLAVPRIWDMLRFRIERELSQSELIQKRLQLLPGFLKRLIIGKVVKRKLGLDRARLCFSGAAKLSTETTLALQDLGIKIHECYGLTETLCVSTITRPSKIVMGSCGKLYSGVEARIENDGEILLRAPFHFKGYYKDPEQTALAIEAGWFRTGDIGHLDSDGNLFITDRKKNLFKTSSGKYVAPLVGETLLKGHPAVREAVVIGEDQPHCVSLISADMSSTSLEDLQRHLERVNAKLPAHEHIKAVGVIKRAWTVDSGELTASYKLKRKVILAKYRAAIDSLYDTRSKVILVDEDQKNEEGLVERAHTGV